MSSPAALKYIASKEKIQTLHQAATDKRLRPMSRDEIQVFYHAALAANVAAWNVYIINLVENFYDVIADPLNPTFDAIQTLAKNMAENALKRFHTPNWENTQELFYRFTGYNPFNDWSGSQPNMNVHQVKERWKEILNVRHSFAHGSDIPAYVWTQSPSGWVRLTSRAIEKTEKFFKNLVKVTDRGLKEHIILTYGISIFW